MPLVPPPHKSTQQQVGSPRQHLLGVSEEPCTLLEPQGGTRTCSRWWTGRTGPVLNSIPIRASQAARLSSCYFYISGPLSRALILLPTPDEHFQTTFIWSCISSACVPPPRPVSSKPQPTCHLLCETAASLPPTTPSMQDPFLVPLVLCAHPLISAQDIIFQLFVYWWPLGFYEILKDKAIFSSLRIPWV